MSLFSKIEFSGLKNNTKMIYYFRGSVHIGRVNTNIAEKHELRNNFFNFYLYLTTDTK